MKPRLSLSVAVTIFALGVAPTSLSGQTCFWDFVEAEVCLDYFDGESCYTQPYYEPLGCIGLEATDLEEPPDLDDIVPPIVYHPLPVPPYVVPVPAHDQNTDGETDCFELLLQDATNVDYPIGATQNQGYRCFANGRCQSGPIDGYRYDHGGIDLPAVQGTPVYATRSGTVVQIADDMDGNNYNGPAFNSNGNPIQDNGNYVRIDYDNGEQGVYLHLETVLVGATDQVTLGEQIGTVDNTGRSSGNHLHYTRYEDNTGTSDWVNPETRMGNCD